MAQVKKIKSPILSQLRTLLSDGIKRIDNGECSEDIATSVMSRLNYETSGYHNDNSYVNYDQAGRILCIPNRTKLKAILDLNGIEQHKINNIRVGFLRTEVEGLAAKLHINE